MITSLSGFEYHGPKKRMAFAPKITPDDFRCAFTAAKGWGTFAQARSEDGHRNQLSVLWGRVPVESLALEVPEGMEVPGARVMLDGIPLEVGTNQEGGRVTLSLPEGTVVEAGANLSVGMQW